ncbi:MAG: DUF4270 domain-containing protein [Prevotellaceae bacterium]|jgi:hypothetical protein|nr:DUF4270 domain-containing protein [Prevotellaceae bacterium]
MKRNPPLFSLLLLAATGIFNACVTADDSFGTGLVPDDQKPRVHVYTITDLPVYTATLDSIQTIAVTATACLFGSINVAPFGTMNANAIFRMYPAAVDHSFGEQPVFTSALLTLIISGHKTADDDQQNIVQNIRLHHLSKTLSYDSTYYNTSISINDCEPTPVNLPGITYNGGDTLEIPLTSAFGNHLLNASATDMDSLLHFYERFKGLMLSVDAQPDGTPGGRLNQLDVSYAMLTLNYKNDAGNDTSFYYYGDYSLMFSAYQHSSSVLANYATPPPTPAPMIYFESLAGVKPVIDLTTIKDSILTLLQTSHWRPDQLVINSAELTFTVKMDATQYLSNFPATLTLCSSDTTDGQLTYSIISDVNTNETFGGALNRSLQCYTFNIAQYLQQLITEEQAGGITSPVQFYLFPTTTVSDSYGYTYTLLDNLSYSYGELLGAGSAAPVKLNLVYTILY